MPNLDFEPLIHIWREQQRQQRRSRPRQGGFIGRRKMYDPEEDRPKTNLGIHYKSSPREHNVPTKMLVKLIQSSNLSPRVVTQIIRLLFEHEFQPV